MAIKNYNKVQAIFLVLVMIVSLFSMLPVNQVLANTGQGDVIYQNDFQSDNSAVSVGTSGNKALGFTVTDEVYQQAYNSDWFGIFQPNLMQEYTGKIYSGAMLSFDILLPAGSTYSGQLKVQAITKMGNGWTWTQSSTLRNIEINDFTDCGDGSMKASVSIPFDKEIETNQGLHCIIPGLSGYRFNYKGNIYIDNVKFVNGTPPDTTPTLPTVQAMTYSFDNSQDVNSWSDGGNWDYSGGLTISHDPLVGNGSMKLDIDYSNNSSSGWSEVKVKHTFTESHLLDGYNKFSFDFYYDASKMTKGSFSAKLSAGTIGNTASVTGAVDDSNTGLKKAKVTIDIPSSNNSASDFTIGVVGAGTDYKGPIYIDNVSFSQETVDDGYITPTKALTNQTSIAVNSNSIVANGMTQATSSTVKLSDDKAIKSAQQIYAYLEAIGKTDSVLFGQQNDTIHKAGNAKLSNSDVKDITGSVSGVVSFDLNALTGGEIGSAQWNDSVADRVTSLVQATKNITSTGAIFASQAHMPNFEIIKERVENYEKDPNKDSYANDSSKRGILADGSYNFSGYSTNVVTGDVPRRVMPGQDLNKYFTAYLDMIADYGKALEKENISILFRPFHEGTGGWFWWGTSSCNADAYKNLFRYTVHYLRDIKGVHNFLYVYGPGSDAGSIEEYAERYPGDDYVDLVGFDMYHDNPTVGDNFIANFKDEMAIVQQFATEHHKLFAVTETGMANASQPTLQSGNARKDWFNEVLDAVAPTNASYFLVWSNDSTKSFYVPYIVSGPGVTPVRAHEMTDNFIDFYNKPNSVFASQVGDYKNIEVSITPSTSASGYIVAPASGDRILDTVTIKASVINGTDSSVVKFVAKNKAGDKIVEIPAAKDNDGYYIGELTSDKLASLGASTGTISLVVDGVTVSSNSEIFNMPVPVINPLVVDTFEDYCGDNGALNAAWNAYKGTGCSIKPSLSSSSVSYVNYEGDCGVKFDYTLTAGGYAGAVKNMNNADWSSMNALQLWTKPDGKNQKVVVQVQSAGNAFETYLNEYPEYNGSTDPLLVTIPFSKFVGRDNKAAVFDPSKIEQFGLWCNTIVPKGEDAATYKLNTSIYYDDIKAVKTDSTEVTFVKTKPQSSVTVPAAPTNVAAIAGSNQATVSFTAPSNDGGSPITGYVVASNPGGITATGAGSPITITGLANGTSYTFTVKAINTVGNSADSQVSNAVTPYVPYTTNPSNANSNTNNNANGSSDTTDKTKSIDFGTVSISNAGGKSVLTAKVDEEKLNKYLESQGSKAVVRLKVDDKADTAIGELTGLMIKNMEDRQATLEIRTENASYILPAQELNIESISKQIGQNVELKDIKVQVQISKSSNDAIKVIEDLASKGKFCIVGAPIDFTVKCSFGDKIVEVKKFDSYVERTIAIPDGVDASKVTTGIVVEEDGSVRQVPTKIVVIDGKKYASINSLTNSTYSLVNYQAQFKDSENHWAREAINDMGSRLIISGDGNGNYQPDKSITRAEFAKIIVSALGLKPIGGKSQFDDVKETDWYNGYVNAASEYAIIAGYGNGKFGADDVITREQAMTIIARAIKVTGLKVDFTGEEADKLLESFADSNTAAAWVKDSIALSIKAGLVSGRSDKKLELKSEITKAEVAVIVRRLLQNSNLI